MGLMYWQIDDIWQAPTSSTIEYGLKWKMGHYYVQHMYEPVYPLAILTPYLANVTDDTARISLYVINELFNGASGHLNCSFLSLDTFSVRSSFTFDVSFDSPALRHLTDLPYSTLMRSAGCLNSSQCLLHCRFNTSQEEIGQTLFLTQPKNYKLYQPNLHIQSIQQLTSTDISITITATRVALFVWLDVPTNVNGYFSRNGFHMFEPMKTVTFHSWIPITDFDNVNFDVSITSLFDITQP
jgi:beta-mannosidase